MPRKANPTDAAYDLYVPNDVKLRSGRQVIDLGFSMEIPHGYAAIIQPRSGFASKGVETIYAQAFDGGDMFRSDCYRLDADVIIGLIDEKYRGGVGVILKVRQMMTKESAIIRKGTRIAQMRIVEVPDTELVEVDELDMSDDRGGGFGHTGTI